MTYHAMSWDPFREVEAMLAGLDRLADRTWSTAGATPGINVYANDDAAVVTTELPGVQPGEVDVRLHEDVLRIAATRKPDSASDGWLVRERPALDYTRSVTLPFPVDPEHIEARLKDGVLTVALKRAASDRPRRIQVNAN